MYILNLFAFVTSFARSRRSVGILRHS